MNKTLFKESQIAAIRNSGVVKLYGLLARHLQAHGFVGDTAATRKGPAFYQLLVNVYLHNGEFGLFRRDFEAIQQVLIREVLSYPIQVNETYVSVQGDFLDLNKEVEFALPAEDKKTLQDAGYWPLLYIKADIPSTMKAYPADGSLENAISAYRRGMALRGSIDHGVSGLYSGAGFSGMPSAQLKEVMTAVGVAKELDRPCTFHGLSLGAIPIVVETLKPDVKVVVQPSQSQKLPDEVRPYLVFGMEDVKERKVPLDGEQSLVEQSLVEEKQSANVLLTGTVIDTNKAALEAVKQTKTYLGFFEKCKNLVVVGKHIPFLLPGERYVYTYREPYDFFCLDSPFPLRRFGDIKLEFYKHEAEFFKRVVVANTRLSKYMLTPRTHRNIALSNSLKIPRSGMVLGENGEMLWSTTENLDLRKAFQATAYTITTDLAVKTIRTTDSNNVLSATEVKIVAQPSLLPKDRPEEIIEAILPLPVTPSPVVAVPAVDPIVDVLEDTFDSMPSDNDY